MKEKGLFEIGYLSYYLILPFIVPIVRVIRSLGLRKLVINFEKYNDPFMLTGIMFFAEMMVGSIDFCLNKSKTTPTKQIELQLICYSKLTPNKKIGIKKKDITFKALGKFFGLSLLDFICVNGLSVSSRALGDYSILQFQLKGVHMIFYSVLGYYILQYKVYQHHYLSIVFIFIGTILITYLSFDFTNWYVIPLILFFFGIMTLQQTLQKWLMHYQYYRPFQILFYEGIFGFAFSLVIILILSFIKCPNTRYCSGYYFVEPMTFFNLIDFHTGIYFFGINLLCLMLINGFNFLVNWKFSPTHLAITEIFSSFFDWILQLSLTDTKIIFDASFFLPLIGYILFVLGGFIYNEIIIFNFCSFGENTKKIIMIRSSIENQKLLEFNLRADLLPDSEEKESNVSKEV